MPIKEVQELLIWIFAQNGLPQWIKVDNGRPFGDPNLELIPLLALWLVCLGIKVIWNRPATPKDNAKVERGQRTMGNWTEYAKCCDRFELQVRLWREADFHNYHFHLKRQNGKTRIELFPKLGHTGKFWNPADFKLKRALILLAKACWERKVSRAGQISLYGQRLIIGGLYKHQKVSVKLNPFKNMWNVFDLNGTLIKDLPTPFSETTIWNLDF